MRSNYLVCYDIADPKRLGRVFRLLKGIGIHLQYSVFYCSLTRPQLFELKERLQERIDNREDDIRIYPLPAGEKITALGQGYRVPDGVDLYLEGGVGAGLR